MVHRLYSLKLSQQLFIVSIALPVLIVLVMTGYILACHTSAFSQKELYVVGGVLFASMLVYVVLVVSFNKRLSGAVNVTHEIVDGIVSGKLNGQLHDVAGSDEIASIAQKISSFKVELAEKTHFVEQVKTGNLDVTYAPRSEHDLLGNSLLAIKETLIRVNADDHRRKWSADGLAAFVDILRSGKSLRDLSNDIIINLVKILNANQGAIFLVSAEPGGEEVLTLQACYAYNRTKYLTQKVGIGEGLIGQTFLEKETMYLKQVPDNFVRITSGLGEANPKNILIVPLRMNEEVIGIAELASFHEFSHHEIEFVEKIGESIAHAIISYRTAENTKNLLTESQEYAEQLRTREEELKQNQEELQATQEEISRKYDALFVQLRELNHQSRFDQLRSITSTKKRNIEYYFDIIRSQIITFSEDRMIIEAAKEFRKAFRKVTDGIPKERMDKMHQELRQYYVEEFIPRLNDNSDKIESADDYLPAQPAAIVLQYLYIGANPHPTGQKSLLNLADDGSDYSRIHAIYHPVIRSFLEKFGYYDIFLIDPETGDMVYSVFKEVDFATSLLTGLYHTTNFGQVVKEAAASTDPSFVRLIDFEPYDPSYRAPASFIACPIYDGDQKIGVIVFQMPINKINQILTGDNKWKEDGLGDSGETIIVGDDHTLRSVSRGLVENPQRHLSLLKKAGYDDTVLRQIRKTNTSILLEKVQSASVGRSLRGESGTQLEETGDGNTILTAYAPLEIPDVRWVIMSTMKEEEVSMRINDLKNR